MICKFYEVGKYKEKINFYLFYGENEGQKIDVIQSNFNEFTKENTFKYNEKEIIENKQLLFENIYSKSFFENEKLILVSEVTDKIFDLIEQIISDNVSDVKIILIAKRLDKKSKIRNLFEKEKIALIVPFYEDSPQTLITIAKKISQSKNLTGKTTDYLMTIEIIFKIEKGNEKKTLIKKEEFLIKNFSDKFEENKLEKTKKESLVNSMVNELIIQLSRI